MFTFILRLIADSQKRESFKMIKAEICIYRVHIIWYELLNFRKTFRTYQMDDPLMILISTCDYLARRVPDMMHQN